MVCAPWELKKCRVTGLKSKERWIQRETMKWEGERAVHLWPKAGRGMSCKLLGKKASWRRFEEQQAPWSSRCFPLNCYLITCPKKHHLPSCSANREVEAESIPLSMAFPWEPTAREDGVKPMTVYVMAEPSTVCLDGWWFLGCVDGWGSRQAEIGGSLFCVVYNSPILGGHPTFSLAVGLWL